VIESLVGEFEPKDALVSEYRRDLRTLLEAKLAGEEIARPEPVPETPVVDLMEALKRSVAEADLRKKAKPSGGKRRAPARKSA
jgi:DNA end-binding protein Ku